MKITFVALLIAATAAAQSFPAGPALDAAIEKAVSDQLIPGGVLVVGHKGQVVYRKAYGWRALVPEREAMTLDTIFDCASLTKVVATTSAIMRLVETGKLNPNDRVTQYLPEFQGGRSEITVRDLLTHFSGLRPDLDMPPKWTGYETGIKLALSDKPVNPPGTRFVYSDINFILLGEIVQRLSGRTLAEFARAELFEPVGMRTSTFNPPGEWIPRIAPTEVENGKPLRGVVHDPTARAMGGIAGHAGLFSTGDDLARFAQMMLDRGEVEGRRVFAAATIQKFTTPETPADQPILRGFGWDIDSPFSSNRGQLFPVGSYGHTGFTGTSIWIDPYSQTYVVFLTNFVHPRAGKSLTGLRGRIATIVAAAVGIDSQTVRLTGYNETLTGPGLRRTAARNGRAVNGVDVLAAENFASLKGQKVGLITNHTGLLRDGRRNVDAMKAAGVNIVYLFTPEHGIAGKRDDDKIADSVDAATGIPIVSLYNEKQRRPTPEMLAKLDTLVFDIQDAGARFYTYSCTLIYALEEAAKHKRAFWVLDRPNPITGVKVEGPILDKELESFVGCFEMPLRHGMTFGEMARMMNGEKNWSADLHVAAMKGWQRGDWFDSAGGIWVDPSPNMRSLNAELLYPGVAMLEYSKNYSVGRGTGAPFEQIGADWIRGAELAESLNSRFIPGVRVYATRFRPESSNFAGKEIEGVRFVITDRESFDSVRLGLEVAYALQKLYPGRIDFEVNRRLIGNRAVIEAMKTGEDPRETIRKNNEQLRPFLDRRSRYLLY